MALTKASYSMIEGSFVNILDFGASTSASDVANGAAIQAALDSLKNVGGTVLIPAGTFSVTSISVNDLSYSGIKVLGMSSQLSILNFTSTGTSVTMGDVSPNYLQNFTFENLVMNSPNSNVMFAMERCDQCSFRKVRITQTGNAGSASKGFFLTRCMATLFEEVSYGGGTNAETGIIITEDSDGTSFFHCYLKGGPLCVNTVVLTAGTVSVAHLVTSIKDCILGGGTNATMLIGNDGTTQCVDIRNNYFETAPNKGIVLGNAVGGFEAQEITIEGNYFYDYGDDAIVLSASTNVSICRNKFIVITGYDISVNPSDATKNKEIIIQQNSLTKNIEINAAQRNIRWQNDDETVRDTFSIYTVSQSWTPGVIAAGGFASVNVAAAGAVLGWIAQASFSLGIGSLSISAAMTADTVCTVVLANNTASPVTLGAGTVRVNIIPT
jgi:hypothetical protein